MIILEYKLEASPNGMRCPDWIDDGGYWESPNNTLVGITRDSPKFHIPPTVIRLTPLQLEDRQLLTQNTNPMYNLEDNLAENPVAMTEAEVRAEVQEWVASKENKL